MKCKHQWKHVVVMGESMKKGAGKFEWLAHKCIKCGKTSVGGRLGNINIKKKGVSSKKGWGRSYGY